MEESMSKMMDKLPELLEQLGEKLGVASAKIWEWALLDVKVEMWHSIIWMFVWLSLIGGCIVFLKITQERKLQLIEKEHRMSFREKNELDSLKFWRVISCVSIAIFILFAFACIGSAIKLIINPEWYAFQNIMKQLGNLK